MTNERHEKALEAACGKHPMHMRHEILEEMFATYLEAMDSVIVPREPGNEIAAAGYSASSIASLTAVSKIYRAMLSKAPNHFTNGE